MIGATILVWAAARPARAQIYSWRDAVGTLVLSDHPPTDQSATYAVTDAGERTSHNRTTRAAAQTDSTGRYEALIARHAQLRHLDPDLVRAVIQVESGFDPRARSNKGAEGLMQLMPATAADYGVRDPYDPAENIRGGTAYLRDLLDRYHDDERLALAAYNAGPGTVDRYGTVPPYAETRQYVLKIRKAAGAADAPVGGRHVIYKTIEIVDGRPVPHYSDKPPASGPYEIVDQPQ
ncbi:MAG TPA: transglycosylase SLT domain-containing protein [Vicinamibacterales bacterium]